MNKIYRLTWNEKRQQYIATAEITRSSGMPQRCLPLIGLCALVLPGQVMALPTGGSLAAGAAQITQSGNSLTITQSSSKAIINWQTYNIGASELVNYVQPGSQAVTLNRILGNSPSRIDGTIQANGQLIFINPNGVVFSSGARVDAAALTVSTQAISDSSFLSGQPVIIGPAQPGAILFNQGAIQVSPGGAIVLSAAQITNSGTLQAPGGSITLNGNGGSTTNQGQIDVSSASAAGGNVALQGNQVALATGSMIDARGASGGGTVSAGDKQADSGQTATFTMAPGATIDVSATGTGNGGHIVTWGGTSNISGGTLLAQGGSAGGNGGLIETSGGWLDSSSYASAPRP